MVDGITKFSHFFPSIFRINDGEFFHVEQYGGKGLGRLFLFDHDGTHGFSQLFLKVTEPYSKRCQGFVLLWGELAPVAGVICVTWSCEYVR